MVEAYSFSSFSFLATCLLTLLLESCWSICEKVKRKSLPCQLLCSVLAPLAYYLDASLMQEVRKSEYTVEVLSLVLKVLATAICPSHKSIPFLIVLHLLNF